ncbi:MAG: fibronectin type III domain-containing protein, partial [Nitrosotalea sp.]
MGLFAFLVLTPFGLLPGSALPLAVASVLPPPTGLVATAVSISQINLSWTAPINNTGVSGYQIERSINASSSWSTVASNTGSTLTSYSDVGLASHTTYTYRVSAIYSGIGISSPSNTASATTPLIAPHSPTGLVAVTVSSSQINLSWTA